MALGGQFLQCGTLGRSQERLEGRDRRLVLHIAVADRSFAPCLERQESIRFVK